MFDQDQADGDVYTMRPVTLAAVLILLAAIAGAFFLRQWQKRDIAVISPPIRPSSMKEIDRGDASKKQVVFTFDGGDGVQSAGQILATLAKHGVRGTFFLTGKFVEQNPDLVKRMAAGNNEIFDHTYDHPHLPTITDAEIAHELGLMDMKFNALTGGSTKPYFRAPYGDRDGRVLSAAFRAGYESVYWTVDAHDWEEPQGVTAPEVEDRILSNLAPGNIYLMHIGDTITGAILDRVFSAIESRGYKIVSLTQGL